MTLDEKIKHIEEVIQEKQYEYQECVATHDMEGATDCRKCAEEHRQLAEWLKELKQLREPTSVIAELEKINIEINLSVKTYTDGAYKRGFDIARLMILEIIDKHISELKGETE